VADLAGLAHESIEDLLEQVRADIEEGSQGHVDSGARRQLGYPAREAFVTGSVEDVRAKEVGSARSTAREYFVLTGFEL